MTGLRPPQPAAPTGRRTNITIGSKIGAGNCSGPRGAALEKQYRDVKWYSIDGTMTESDGKAHSLP